MSRNSPHSSTSGGLLLSAALVSCILSGCQDGPMYALKTVNPYYVMNEWRADEKLGVTDHERRTQMISLAETIHTLPSERQTFWAGQLTAMVENDDSPEMRRLAVRAARKLNGAAAITIIEKGLDDSSMKVRMEACRSLGSRTDEQSVQLLASTLGTEANEDVKRAAVEALANHKSQVAIDSLRLALADRNPATRSLAVQSLRDATGKNYGDDPEVWIAALEGKPTEQAPTRFAERIRGLF